MSEEDDNAPIVAKEFRFCQVIDLAGVRIERGISRRPFNPDCKHRHLTYDPQERRVWCVDCEKPIPAFDAFMVQVNHWGAIVRDMMTRRKEIEDAESHALISRAAKVVDEGWRSRRMAPCCSQCGAGLLPEDFANGLGRSVSREMEQARRRKAEALKAGK